MSMASASPTLTAVLDHPIVGRDDEQRLLRRYAKLRGRYGATHRKTVACRNEIMSVNMRLVAAMAKRYQAMPREDVISEGVFGLAIAIERFDVTRNLRFSTFAKWWVFAKMQRAVAAQARVISLPVNMRATRAKEGREWDGVTIETAPLSMDANVFSDGSPRSRHDLIADAREGADVAVDNAWKHDALRGYVHRLPERERSVLVRRFGLDGDEPENLQQIGDRMGLSRERIRQIECDGLRELRDALNAKAFA
jgi:RNA polymerase sigma factor (sigma-70 family)